MVVELRRLQGMDGCGHSGARLRMQRIRSNMIAGLKRVHAGLAALAIILALFSVPQLDPVAPAQAGVLSALAADIDLDDEGFLDGAGALLHKAQAGAPLPRYVSGTRAPSDQIVPARRPMVLSARGPPAR